MKARVLVQRLFQDFLCLFITTKGQEQVSFADRIYRISQLIATTGDRSIPVGKITSFRRGDGRPKNG